MALPSDLIQWANTQRYDPLIGFTNRLKPLKQVQDSGLIATNNPKIPNEMMGDAYFNYQMNLISEWIVHLRDRSQVDDVLIWETTGQASNLGTLFGGTWSELGSDTIAGVTKYIYRRTA